MAGAVADRFVGYARREPEDAGVHGIDGTARPNSDVEVLFGLCSRGVCVVDESEPLSPDIRHYFVDETGDATLFDATGRVIVGNEGCSLYFALGVLDIPDAWRLRRS